MQGDECIHCGHRCHCDMMCSYYEQEEKQNPLCKCDECNCRPPDWEPSKWGSNTEDME